MSIFASPIFQNLVSLTHHCPPKPILTTYQVYYCDPESRYEREPPGCPGQFDIDVIDVKGIKTLKKRKTDSGMCCSKRVTTYKADYTAPDDHWVKLLNG